MFKQPFFFSITSENGNSQLVIHFDDIIPFNDISQLFHHQRIGLFKLLECLFDHLLTTIKYLIAIKKGLDSVFS